MRLSKDDDGVSESASITTQRKMLHSYAKEHGFQVYQEYIDDGFSGTDFNRPAWKRMIADIESKKINLIITKDLSRLGRDYITTGQYTEIYFPSKGVRYIAINDGYDSDSPYTDIAPFKNVINEMYARDISKKIRSAFQIKMKEGAFIGNFAPYGYMKDPNDKNHLIIDYMVAPIVQELFQLAEEGSAPGEIAKLFNQRGIMTPAMYRCLKRPYLNVDDYSKKKEWTSAMVCKMLRNIVYLGHVAQGKTTKVSFKSHITLQNPRDEWIVAYNMHEPLITQETFENVRKRSVSRRINPKTNFSNVFSGIAKCVDCGRNMSTTGSRRKDSLYNLVCGGYKLYGSRECSNHFIDYNLLYKIVLQELKQLLTLTETDKKEILEAFIKQQGQEKFPQKNGTLVALQKREEELDHIVQRLYEDNVSGKLDDVRFYKMLAGYEAEQKELSSRLALLIEPPVKETSEQIIYQKFFAMLNEITNVNELTSELLQKLIDRIEIGQGTFKQGKKSGRKYQVIKIYYKFIGQIETPT